MDYISYYSIILRQRLPERGFICNRIDFDAVARSVYTTPIETVIETSSIAPKIGAFSKRCGFICRVNSETASI